MASSNNFSVWFHGAPTWSMGQDKDLNTWKNGAMGQFNRKLVSNKVYTINGRARIGSTRRRAMIF